MFSFDNQPHTLPRCGTDSNPEQLVGAVVRCSSPTVKEGLSSPDASCQDEPSLTVGLLHRATAQASAIHRTTASALRL